MGKTVQPGYPGGVQIKTNKFYVRPDELALALNVRNEVLGSWWTRNGTDQTGDKQANGITGLFGDMNSGGKHLLVTSSGANSILKYNNSGVWTNITGATTLPLEVNANFVPFIDKTYVFGVNEAGTFMTTGSLAGTTYTEEATFPKAAFGNVFGDRVYLVDCEVDGVRYRNRAYYASIPSYNNGWSFDFTPATDYLQFSTNDGDYLTGVMRSYGQNLFFKNYSIHVIDQNQNIIPVDGVGCTSSRSLVSDDDKNVYFAHFSNKKKGIFRWDGTGAKKISRGVDPFIKGCAGTGIVGGIDSDHVLMFIGDVTLDTSIAEYYGLETSYSNVLLDYSIEDDIWLIHTLPYPISVIAPNESDLYLGTANGYVGAWDSGDTDFGSAVTSTVITHNFYGLSASEYNLRKAFKEQVVMMHEGGTATAYRSIDNGAWVETCTADEKVNNHTINGKGYGIKSKLTGTFKFEGIEYTYDLEKALKSS